MIPTMQQGFRLYPPGCDSRARGEQFDVDRAIEVLCIELAGESNGTTGTVRDVRRRMDVLLNDLFPPISQTHLHERLSDFLGFSVRARAVDAAVATLLRDCPPGTRTILPFYLTGNDLPDVRRSLEQEIRAHVADALDDAYCVMLPYEASRRSKLQLAFWPLMARPKPSVDLTASGRAAEEVGLMNKAALKFAVSAMPKIVAIGAFGILPMQIALWQNTTPSLAMAIAGLAWCANSLIRVSSKTYDFEEGSDDGF